MDNIQIKIQKQKMIRKILNLVEKSEDEKLEFDGRYTSTTKRKIDEIKKHYLNLNLFDKLISENTSINKKLQPTKNRAKAMSYYDELFTTNKIFKEWNEVFPNAACVVTLIDRMVHRSEIVQIEGESYRLKEAKEAAAKRAKRRRSSKFKPPTKPKPKKR